MSTPKNGAVGINDLKQKTGDNAFSSLVLTQYALRDYDFTLLAANWSGASAPYTQTISSGLTGLTSDSMGTVGISQTATQEQYQAAAKAQLRCTAQGNGTLTMSCYGTKPTVNIPCKLIGVYEPLVQPNGQ